ncbi:hypothetical protein AVEN_7717-1 [Araneus ventricosus]|uniref:Uncharacterized protein n=1 Tax=Araneus ventricosus TaxID=182803 RepID=A0A4Y2U266_ARAVE|nr:hypothetical protein AVEN_7717-1 [Araneus ventricosus]
MTRTTSQASLLQISTPHQREDIWALTYDLTRKKPHSRWIFSRIGFRSTPRSYHQPCNSSSLGIFHISIVCFPFPIGDIRCTVNFFPFYFGCGTTAVPSNRVTVLFTFLLEEALDLFMTVYCS